jgi:2-iminobutanoate/2-iminopropanoate deaminase
MKILLILFCMGMAAPGIAQTVKLSNPASVFTPKGYSHVAEIDLGNSTMLLLSGQVPLDKAGNLVGEGDLAKQADQTFLNIKNIIEEAGGSMNDIVKLGVYLVDMGQIQAYRNARDKYIKGGRLPASTAVQVVRLFREDVLIEVEATAIVPRKR